ncbi:MAG: family 43 glycosylhydrolase [Oligoflexus sp.]|nr:family 43 glycosylhydrolase [Pseudopedobacter sp.]
MKKYLILLIFVVLVIANVKAQNPIVPPGVYIADPATHVWKDGKLYVYGSTDESPNYYCSYQHDVLSTTDLKTWTITKNSFDSKGNNDKVPYNDALLFAPDVQYKNGLYYLYYCQPDNNFTEGVASSKFPLGPFTNAKPINLYGRNQIDPAVFVDDDGQAYYIWGQFQAKMAKLKSNMTEIDSATIKDNVITEKEHFFHEGGYMIKRNDIYYFIYTHMGRAGRPTCIGYATSKSPMGPFEYGGVIIDNDHADPANWNNHGSIIEFNNHWYVFYHRSTHGSNTMRKACVEPINFNSNGSITEVEMTTQGAGDPLDAKQKIDAERACLLYGNVRIEAIANDNEALTQIKKGDYAGYKYIDFKEGANSVEISVTPGNSSGTVEIVLDNAWNSAIGAIKIPDNTKGNLPLQLTAKIQQASGIHAVWLRFTTNDSTSFKVDWFKFK